MSIKEFDDYVREALEALSTEPSDRNTSDEEINSSYLPGMRLVPYDHRVEPLENYIFRLEAFFDFQNIPQEKKANAVISSLQPNLFALLKNWLYPISIDTLSYEKLKRALTELLSLKPRVLPSRRKFFNRKQEEGESVFDYVNELRRLIGECRYPSEMVDMILRDVFVSGVRSSSILNGLLERDDISLESTVELAEFLEKKERENRNFGQEYSFKRSCELIEHLDKIKRECYEESINAKKKKTSTRSAAARRYRVSYDNSSSESESRSNSESESESESTSSDNQSDSSDQFWDASMYRPKVNLSCQCLPSHKLFFSLWNNKRSKSSSDVRPTAYRIIDCRPPRKKSLSSNRKKSNSNKYQKGISNTTSASHSTRSERRAADSEDDREDVPPVNRCTSSTDNPSNVDQPDNKRSDTNSTESQNRFEANQRRSSVTSSQNNQPNTSFRTSTKTHSIDSVNLPSASSPSIQYRPSIDSACVRFKGRHAAKCCIKFPGFNSMMALVALDWFGSNDATDIGELMATTVGDKKVLLSLNLCEVSDIIEISKNLVSLRTLNDENDSPGIIIQSIPNQSSTENILDYIFIVWKRVYAMPLITRRSIWAIKHNGDVYVAEIDSLKERQMTSSGRYMKEYRRPIDTTKNPMALPNGCPYNSEITVYGFVPSNAERFHVNLICGHNRDIALHFNPRFEEHVIVRNSHMDGEWGQEERGGHFQIHKKSTFKLTITCMEKKFEITVNGTMYDYDHRVSPELITNIEIGGQVNVLSIRYECDEVIMNMEDLTWTKKGYNQLRLIETCSKGLIWGISKIGMPMVYVDKANEAAYLRAVEQIAMKDLTLNVLDEYSFAVWAVAENGKIFYRHGVTTKCFEGTKWEHVPADQPMRSISGEGRQVWCCSEDGVCFWRSGITADSPLGECWQSVKSRSGCVIRKVAVGKGTVWALDDLGDLYVRKQMSSLNPAGVYWSKLWDQGLKFEHVHVSDENVWAITDWGDMCRRVGITTDNPAGVHWDLGSCENWSHISVKE